jgi:hypothetical protein
MGLGTGLGRVVNAMKALMVPINRRTYFVQLWVCY